MTDALPGVETDADGNDVVAADPAAEAEPTTRYVEDVSPLVPFRAPRPWRPVYTNARPWTAFALIVPEVEDVDPIVAEQITAETARWLLDGALVELRETPREGVVDGLAERLEQAVPLVAEWRETFYADPDPEEGVEETDWHGYPSDPREKITEIARFLLEDPEGGGEGADEDEDESEGDDPDNSEPSDEDMLQALAAYSDMIEEEESVELSEEEEEALLDEEQAQEDRETLSRILPSQRHYGTGSQDPGVSPEKLEELAERFSDDPKWSKFLDLIGRISADAWALPATVQTTARENVRDLELGADLSRLLSTEIMRFGVVQLAGSAYVDYVERRMMQIAMEGQEPKGRGPILVAIDMSASMGSQTNIENLSRLDLSLVLGLALVRVADVQNRPVFLLGFSDNIVFERQLRTARERVDAMLHLTSGLGTVMGTNFDVPLNRLMQVSRMYEGGDLLMITDGEARIADNVVTAVKQKKAAGMRVFSLLIGGSAADAGLIALSDNVVKLKDETDLLQIGKSIATAPAVEKTGEK